MLSTHSFDPIYHTFEHLIGVTNEYCVVPAELSNAVGLQAKWTILIRKFLSIERTWTLDSLQVLLFLCNL